MIKAKRITALVFVILIIEYLVIGFTAWDFLWFKSIPTTNVMIRFLIAWMIPVNILIALAIDEELV